ncbi:hypothetical protein K0U83_06080 [bacterium]|nr:hypothetical protein [bacterium]
MTTDTQDQPGGSTGLLDNVSAADDTTTTNPQAADIDHKADPATATAVPGDIPGTAKTKPEYLPDNFWDGDKGEANYEALAKSWSDLRKTISQGKHKAPEGGKYDTAIWGDGAEENPMAQAVTNWAKENGISQAQFEDLVGNLQSQAKELMSGQMVDPAEEMKKLGPNGNAVVDGMVNWARGLVQKGIWGADDFDEFKVMGGTANGLRALMKVRESYEGRIPIETAPNENAPSKDDLYQMVGDPRYKTDAAYRQKVEKLFSATIR